MAASSRRSTTRPSRPRCASTSDAPAAISAPVTQIVAVDIGGTNARFAIADLANGAIALQPETVLPTRNYANLQSAWEAFVARLDGPPPRGASICIAGPVRGEVLRLTNHPWVIRPAALKEQLK